MNNNITPPASADSVWREIIAKTPGYWFSAESMRYFNSRVLWGSLECRDGVGYFVSSEQYRNPLTGYAAPRRYTVRSWTAADGVNTVGEFEGYATSREAKAVIARIVKGGN